MKLKQTIARNKSRHSSLTKHLSKKNKTNPVNKPKKRQVKSKKDLKVRPNQRPNPELVNLHHDSVEFRELQKAWYDRLAADGFKDLELFTVAEGIDPVLGNNHNNTAPRRLARAMKQCDLREEYYRRLTNFITHNPQWSRGTGHDALAHAVALLYIQGISYRKMLPILATKSMSTNIWRISHIVTDLENKATAWNRSHPEGLDFEPDVGLQYGIKKAP